MPGFNVPNWHLKDDRRRALTGLGVSAYCSEVCKLDVPNWNFKRAVGGATSLETYDQRIMKPGNAPAIVPRIFAFRGESVMLDSDLAILYGVETRVFNQAIARNVHRFPADFAFQLQRKEFTNLMSQIVTSSSHGGRRKLPWVFTEHGAVMLASVLNSAVAIAASVEIVRAFVKMRDALSASDLVTKLTDIEKRISGHDKDISSLFGALRQLLETPRKERGEIGYHTLREDATSADLASLPRRQVRYAAPRRTRKKTAR